MKLQKTNEKEILRQNEKKESLIILEDYIKKLEISLGDTPELDFNYPKNMPKGRLCRVLSSGLYSKAESIATEINFISNIYSNRQVFDIETKYENKLNEMKRLYIRSLFLKEGPHSLEIHGEKKYNDYVEKNYINKSLNFDFSLWMKFKYFTEEEIISNVFYEACEACLPYIDDYIDFAFDRHPREYDSTIFDVLHIDYYIRIMLNHEKYDFEKAKEHIRKKFNKLIDKYELKIFKDESPLI